MLGHFCFLGSQYYAEFHYNHDLEFICLNLQSATPGAASLRRRAPRYKAFTMKIIALEKETDGIKPSDFKPYLKSEAKKVWELHQSGLIREIHFRQDQKSAVLIIECDSVERAEQIISQLPLVKEGLICFEFIPLVPYTGFERLFK